MRRWIAALVLVVGLGISQVDAQYYPSPGAYVEDTPHVSGSIGLFGIGVRNDGGASMSSADGDYTPITVDSTGALRTTGSFSEQAIAPDGDPLPSEIKIVGGYDGSAVQVLSTDSNGELQVDVLSSALPTGAATEATLSTLNGKVTTVDTDNVTVVSSALPTGAATEATVATLATEATLSTLNGKVTAVDTGNVTVTSSALPTGAATEATLSTLNGKVTAVDTGNVTVSSSALPTGAATEATLSSIDGNIATIAGDFATETTLSSIDTKITDVDTGNVTVTSSALPTGAATAANQATIITSLSNIETYTNRTPRNGNITGSYNAVVGTSPVTETAPADAIGFFFSADDGNAGTIYWQASGTASVGRGHVLEPSRDTGFVPLAVDLSIISDTASQNYNLTWIRR